MDIEQLIRQQAQEKGVDPDLAVSIARAESSLNPSAKNPKSSARGLFQVTNDTWKQYGGDPKKRTDLNENIRVGLDIIADNTRSLSDTLGRAPRPAEVYAAHFFGKTGARRVLKADPNAPISQVVSPAVMKANKSLLEGKTVAQAVNALGRKVGDAPEDTTAQTSPAIPPLSTGAPRARPAVDRPVDGGYREDPANPPVISQAIEATRGLGPGYQAALALSYLADTEESSDDPDEPRIVEREAAEEADQMAQAAAPARSNAAQMLASMDFGYAPVVGQQQQPQQEPVRMFMGGLATKISRAVSGGTQGQQTPPPNFTPEEIAQIRRGLSAQGFKEPEPKLSLSSTAPASGIFSKVLPIMVRALRGKVGPSPNQLTAAELQALYGTTGLAPQMVDPAPRPASGADSSNSPFARIISRALRGTTAPVAAKQVPQYGLTQELLDAKRAQLRGTERELGFGEVMPEAWEAYKARFPTLATFTPGQLAPVSAPAPIEVPTGSVAMPLGQQPPALNIYQPGSAAAMLQNVLVPTGSIMDMQAPVRMAQGGLLERAASVVPFSPTARRQHDEARAKWEAFQEQANAYNSALETWRSKYYDPYMTEVEKYNKAVETWNKGPRTSDFGMKAPTLGQEFTMTAPTEPNTLSPEEMTALVERAQRQRGQQAQALQVAANPEQFGLSMPSLFADGGEVTDPYAQMMQGAPTERVSPGQFVRGGFDTAAGMLKGATQAAIGLPGDIESLIRMGVGSERDTVLPTTDDVKRTIDRFAPLNLPADEGTGGRTAAEYFGEFLSPAAATRPVVRGAQALGTGVMEGARQTAPAAREMLQNMPAGLSVKPTGSFTPLPSAEAPFVGRLDQFAASMPGPMKKDQLLGTIGNKFKNYEIERARRALEDLPDDAKVLPTDFLNRLNNVNNPANYRTTVIEPEPNSFWQSVDNVFYDPVEGSGQLGVIHLSRFQDPATARSASLLATANTGLNRLAMGSRYDPEGFDALMQWARTQPDGVHIERTLTTGPVAAAREQLMRINKLDDMNNMLLYPNLSEGFSQRAENLREGLIRQRVEKGMDPIEARLTTYGEAYDATAKEVIEEGRKMWQELGLPGKAPTPSGDVKNIATPWVDDEAYAKTIKEAISTEGKKYKEAAKNQLFYAQDALQDIETRLRTSPDRAYMSQHSSLRNPPEAIAFSRFSEHTANIPGLGQRKGIYVSELQSDLLDDIRKNQVAKSKEAFPDMAILPQATQQLMIKNAINAAIQRGDEFVAFPGKESKQAQLYEKLPNNLKDVTKELGPGFTRVPIELTLPGGEKTMFEGITWGTEAAQRLQKQGIPFAKGGMVERKTSDNRSYK